MQADKITMSRDMLDDGSMVINFDVIDEHEDLIASNGYVIARQDDEDQCFYVTIFNHEGDVISETSIPFTSTTDEP